MSDYTCAVCKEPIAPNLDGSIDAKQWVGPGGNIERADGRWQMVGPRVLAHVACAEEHPEGPQR